jgi:hypothetical protein
MIDNRVLYVTVGFVPLSLFQQKFDNPKSRPILALCRCYEQPTSLTPSERFG